MGHSQTYKLMVTTTNPMLKETLVQPHLSPLEALTDLLRDDMASMTALIAEQLSTDISLIPEVGHHLIDAGGKRIRPLLTMATCRLFGYEGPHHVNLAASIEFIHTATLLHDDVVDDSPMRRGQPSAKALWGNNASILVGDFLFSRSFQLMTRSGHQEILAMLSQASATIAAGEVYQLMVAHQFDLGEENYLKIIHSKTASLFEASCAVGPLLTAQSPEVTQCFKSYGYNLGMAFQLIDDVLDYMADAKRLGKKIGDDFREGKITLPVLLAYQQGTAEERGFWARTMVTLEQHELDFPKACQLLTKYDTLSQCRELAQSYADKAIKEIAFLPDSSLKGALSDLPQFCVTRGH